MRPLSRRSGLGIGLSIPLSLALFAAADLALRCVPLDRFAFRAIEGIGRQPPGYAPYLPDRHYENPATYGDLAAMGNVRRLRQYRLETATSDRWGYRNPPEVLEHGPPEAILIGDSFGLGSGILDSETLSARLLARCGVSVYNAAGGMRPLGLQQIREISHRLGMRHGIVIHEFLERQGIPIPPGVARKIPTIRYREIHAAMESFEEKKRLWIKSSRLRILAERFYRFFQNDVFLPNSLREKVFLSRLVDGNEMLFLPSDEHADGSRPTSTAYWRWLQGALSAEGLKLVVLLVPNKYTVYGPLTDFPLSPDPSGDYPERLERALERDGVPVVNLKQVFRHRAKQELPGGRYLYFADDTHWNAEGIDLAAEQLRSVLPCTQATGVESFSGARGASPAW